MSTDGLGVWSGDGWEAIAQTRPLETVWRSPPPFLPRHLETILNGFRPYTAARWY